MNLNSKSNRKWTRIDTNIRVYSCLFVVAFLTFITSVTRAEEPPLPQRKAADIHQRLAAEKEKETQLNAQLKTAEKQLEKTKKEMVDAAAQAQAGEKLVQGLEKRLAALSAEDKTLRDKLAGDYGAMAGTILAMERLRRIPPEALIVRPGAPLQTAQTALLLKSIMPVLNERAASLSADLRRLTDIRTALDNDRRQALEAKAATDKKYGEIAALAKKREALYRKLDRDHDRAAAAVAQIAREARSMEELLARLEEQDDRYRATSTARPWSMPKPGKPELPVPGPILTGFDETDRIGAHSQGLTIEAQPRALVVAPMGGYVRFAGNFKNYGKMVILEHEDGWHSLVAGLEDINAAVGQSVDAGEPVGKLPSASSRGGKPTLYYELRFKGQAVDPARKFSNLKDKNT